MKKKSMPETIFVVKEQDDPQDLKYYLISFEDYKDLARYHGELVGIYTLKKEAVVSVRTEIDLEEK